MHEEYKEYTVTDVAKAAAATIVLLLPIAFVCAAAQYLVRWEPVIWAPAFIVGVSAGSLAETHLRRFRISGLCAALCVGFAGGAAALWSGWLTYAWLWAESMDLLHVITHPAELPAIMETLAEHPFWESKDTFGRPSAPGFHWVVWMAEAAVLLCIPLWMCRRFTRKNKICSGCGDWLRSVGDGLFLAVPEDGNAETALLEDLRRGDLSPLKTLCRLRDGEPAAAGKWLTVYRHACANCAAPNAHITVVHFALKYHVAVSRNTLPVTKINSKETVLVNMEPVDPKLEAALFRPCQYGGKTISYE